MHCCGPLRFLIVSLCSSFLMLTLGQGRISAQTAVTVTVSPGVVPVGTIAAVKSPVLVTATVSSVPPGTQAACTVSLTSPTGSVLPGGDPMAVSTSPAPASGVTSLSVQRTVPGGTSPGAAQATVTCGGVSASAAFRISSLVALNVTPTGVPVGGVVTLAVIIATNGPLPLAAPCTVVLTAPPGATPALSTQTISVSGGSSTNPASASTTVTLPQTASTGPANASASCVIQGVGTVGDSTDFTIASPGVVSILGLTSPVAPGSSVSITVLTNPGFRCTAQLTPPAGTRLSSAAALADSAGTAVLSISIPTSAQPGNGSLLVTCNDPANPSNTASSTTQSVSITGSGAVAIQSVSSPITPGSSVSVAVATRPGFVCVASFTPFGGSALSSPSAIADPNGAVMLSIILPASTSLGVASVGVTCTDPANPSVTAVSAPQQVTVGSVAGVNIQSITNPVKPGGTLSIAVTTKAGFECSAQLELATGSSLTSPTVAADSTGAATLTLIVPASARPAPASVSVTCADPTNAALSVISPTESLTVSSDGGVTVQAVTSPAVPGGALSITVGAQAAYVCAAQLQLATGSTVLSPSIAADQNGIATMTLVVPLTAPSAGATVSVSCTDPNDSSISITSPPQSVQVVSLLSAALVNPAQAFSPGAQVSVIAGTLAGAACTIQSFTGADGAVTLVSEPSASGTAPAGGSLTLAFHLPPNAAPGLGQIQVGCTAEGAQTSVNVAVEVGSAFASSASASRCGDVPPATPAGAAPALPVASPGSGYSGQIGQPIQFSGAGSQPSAGALLNDCRWDFGDGDTATTLNPTHVYSAAGSYTVSLTVFDSAGQSATAQTAVQVGGFVAQCATLTPAATITLGACTGGISCPSTSLPGQCLPACQTLIQADNPAFGLCPQPGTSVRVSAGGPYTGVALQSIALQAGVVISGTRRVCSADATLGTAGPFCHLVPANNLPQPADYVWNFGDGTSADGARVYHAFPDSGSYPVTLTVTMDDGSNAIAATTVTVTAAPPTPVTAS